MKLSLSPIVSRLWLLVLLSLGVTTISLADHSPSGEVRIGILAKRGEQVATAKWQATADYLTAASGDHRSYKIIPLAFDEIPSVVRNNLIDFVIVNSAIYVDLSVRYGVRRILTMNNRVANHQSVSQFGTVIFVRSDSALESTLVDLQGKRLAAVHETSLGGWILGRYTLEQKSGNIKDLELLTFSGTHDQVVRDVLAGKVDIGIVRTDTLERMALEGKLDLGQVRVLNPRAVEGFPFYLSSELLPEWPISQLRHVSDQLSGEVALALLQMKESDQAAIDARITGWSIPQNYQRVHEVLKVMDLPPYDVNEAITLVSVVRQYWFWILLVLVVLVAQSGLIASVARLNSRLHQKRESLERSEDQFRSLFQQAAVGFVFTTPTGSIQQANHQLSEITGYSEVELRQMNVADLLHAETLPIATSNFEAMRRGESSQFMLQAPIKTLYQKDVWAQFTLNAIRDEKHGIKYLVGVFDDISDLKLLEDELKTEQNQKSLILDIAGDGILGIDRAGRHTFVNPAAARLLGYRPEELIGRDSHATWHHSLPDGSPFAAGDCPITAVLSAGIIHRGHNELFWRKDGSSVATEYVSTPIFDGSEVIGAVVVFREQDNKSQPSPDYQAPGHQ